MPFKKKNLIRPRKMTHLANPKKNNNNNLKKKINDAARQVE
jgi:hypothetical protein